VAEFKAARSEGRDPVTLRIASLERSLEAARRAGEPLNNLAIELANAREDFERVAPPPDGFFETLRCYELGAEAWLLRIAEPAVRVPEHGAPRDWSVEGDYELVHFDHGSPAGRLRFPKDSLEPTFKNDTPQLVDLDGDEHVELLWVAWVHPKVRTFAFTYRDQRVTSMEEIPVPGVLRSIESGGEARRGLLTYAVQFDDSARCLVDEEIEHDSTTYSSPLFAEVIDGKLVLESPLIREKLRTWCSKRPPAKVTTGDEVLCARLYGVSSASLLRQIEQRYVDAPCTAGTTAVPAGKVATHEYGAMINASRWKPPFVFK
jgi:hypothetical protein